MEFEKELKKKIGLSEDCLRRYMPGDGTFPPILFEAMAYSLFAGGKRLRPVLLLSMAEAYGGTSAAAAPFMAAIEMIHTYSLIHDDLPAMDNDDFRRGRLTNHKVYGEDVAILAGDGLLSLAFEIMADAVSESMDKRPAQAMQAIAKGVGVFGMVGGQTADVISEGKPVDKALLEFIHVHKTASMIQGAMAAGAILGGASGEQAALVKEAAEKIGVAFQVQDDILDVTGTTEALGKPVHSDEKNQKTTYVTLFGIDASRETVRRLSREAKALLSDAGGNGDFLCALVDQMTERSF